MDLLVLLKHQSTNLRDFVFAFRDDVMRLLRASPIFGGIVLATGVALGFVPILLWQYFGNFVNASFASRGVGTMTSDLSHSAVLVALLSVLLIAAGAYFLQTKALSRTIASTIAVAAIFVTHIITLLPIEKSFIIFLAVLAIGFHVVRHRAALIAVSGVLILLSISAISDILYMMSHRSMTVGSAMEYCLVILTLAATSAWIAHRK
ncbi:MAG: hypothetical protein AAB473_04740 [Patescibacteria group bacterium]